MSLPYSDTMGAMIRIVNKVSCMDERDAVKALEQLVSGLSYKTIETNGSPYLTRWYVHPSVPRTLDNGDELSSSPTAVFIHKFHRGDIDREEHSHPWDVSMAIVLAGGYRETRNGEIHREYRPGDMNIIRADDYHKVELLDPGLGSWSLFVAGRGVSGWGFRDPRTGTVIPWQEYEDWKRRR